jgi:hypothetical protein
MHVCARNVVSLWYLAGAVQGLPRLCVGDCLYTVKRRGHPIRSSSGDAVGGYLSGVFRSLDSLLLCFLTQHCRRAIFRSAKASLEFRVSFTECSSVIV